MKCCLLGSVEIDSMIAKQMKLNTHKLLREMRSRQFIAMDAEFADGRYMLELSIYDNSGELIYNQRFRPKRISTWRLDPHNITPEDVKDMPYFSECIADIQNIIDESEFILGFDLKNDIKVLRREGISISSDKSIVELRDWFWMLYGSRHDFDYENRVSNESVAKALDVEVELDESKLHSAHYDTMLSLLSFSRLMDYLNEINIRPESFEDAYSQFQPLYKASKDIYDAENAAGYCYIRSTGDRYLIDYSSESPEEDDRIIASIHVANKKRAKIDISALFLGRNVAGKFKVDKISPAKLSKFKSYSNTFNCDDKAYDAKILQLTKMYGGKKRL